MYPDFDSVRYYLTDNQDWKCSARNLKKSSKVIENQYFRSFLIFGGARIGVANK